MCVNHVVRCAGRKKHECVVLADRIINGWTEPCKYEHGRKKLCLEDLRITTSFYSICGTCLEKIESELTKVSDWKTEVKAKELFRSLDWVRANPMRFNVAEPTKRDRHGEARWRCLEIIRSRCDGSGL